MPRDTRHAQRALISGREPARRPALGIMLGCLGLALAVAFLPPYPELDIAGRWALAILVLAAGLWVTEAMPAFAVGLLVIGLAVAILGAPGGVFAGADEPSKWRMFIAPWSSPLIWLFMGGFILAAAAAKTRLDRAVAGFVLRAAGPKPQWVLAAAMGVTFVLSMFIANTATAAMMLAVTAPLLDTLEDDDPQRTAMLLGVAFAANLGGMGTLIGTPPNAIAAGALLGQGEMSFLTWMMLGLPPALVLLVATWGLLQVLFPCRATTMAVEVATGATADDPRLPWQRWVVLGVALVTIALWMSGGLGYDSPSTVVAFIPILVLTATGIVGADDIRRLPWDVLLLISGGLTLGVVVTETGLAQWLVDRLPLAGAGPVASALVLATATLVLSNFMSNTGAANILVPIALALSLELPGAGTPTVVVVAVALGASAAMALPIATPPNAIAFATGRLRVVAFIQAGLVVGALTPAVAVGWVAFIVPALGL